MFLRAGLLSLALLVASRLLGLVRESAVAATFGVSGLGDVAVLMLALPDWLAGVVASGMLAYVMLPAWSAQEATAVAATQRRLAFALAGAGAALAIALAWLRHDVLDALVSGLSPALHEQGVAALFWSAGAVPFAMLAALWATRLQHERDFVGLYGANLVVNAALIVALWMLFGFAFEPALAIAALGWGLVAAMALRLGWLHRRMPARLHVPVRAPQTPLPAAATWLWAAGAAGLPLALPFAARSIASSGGEGALATFNYAWKLVELPLLLAIQLVATLAFPAVARAFAAPQSGSGMAAAALRPAFALAWTLACAAAAALILAAPALAQLLFGWGRMDPLSLATIAGWAQVGAWGLLPQSLLAVALTALAGQRRMRPAVFAYAAALGLLFVAAAAGWTHGAVLMACLNALFAGVALSALAALGREGVRWLPWTALVAALLPLALCALWVWQSDATRSWPLPAQLAAALAGALLVSASAFTCSADLRAALRR